VDLPRGSSVRIDERTERGVAAVDLGEGEAGFQVLLISELI
jgi:hypothetical protein